MTTRKTPKLCLFLWMTVMCLSRLVGQEVKKPFTVADSIEATEVLQGPLMSNDGQRYIVVLHHGDIARNGSWIELLYGSIRSANTTCKPSVVARLFSTSTVGARDLIKDVRWLDDNEHVTFLWASGKMPASIVAVNVRTRQVKTLVSHSTPIAAYDISHDGQVIVFVAEAQRNASNEDALAQKGFVVAEQSLESILQRNYDGWTRRAHYETFVLNCADGITHIVREANSVWGVGPELLKLSPDARYAVAVEPSRSVPASWNEYTEHILRDDYIPAARSDPDGPNLIRQYYIVDVKRTIAEPLWDAPENPYGDAVWSPDGRQLAIGPTFAPVPQSTAMGLSGQAVAVVSIESKQFELLPVSVTDPEPNYQPISWTRDGVLQIRAYSRKQGAEGTLSFSRNGGKWAATVRQDHIGRPEPGVQIEVQEGPNSPPALYAVESAGGSRRMILDLDPKVRNSLRLAHVEPVHWQATDGRQWTGMLYYPVNYHPEHAYPLVIQTHGYSTERFKPDGVFTTVFAAQELANLDIAVLQVGGSDSDDRDVLGTPREPEVFMAGVEGAIQHFSSTGLLDPARVGIIGFSRTGWHVEYILTHSDFVFGAAEVADNIDGSYLQYEQDGEIFRAFYQTEKGAAPFGKGLETWFQKAPGFNCDKIHTPLRMEIDSGPIDEILEHWEIFSNLRHLNKPVELSVIPDIEHGTHILQNPAQRMASQGGTVDWFAFWLKGEEFPDPAKADQYARWRKLRELQHADNRVAGTANSSNPE